MAKGRPRRHHYIPRMIQRNFVHEEGGLYFWRRNLTAGDVRSTTPANLFVEDDLYVIIDRNGSRDVGPELWFSRLESDAAVFIGRLLEIVRKGQTPVLDSGAWEFWHHYNYFAQKRSVAWHSQHLTRDDLFQVAKTLASPNQWAEHLRAWEQNPAEALRVLKNSRVFAQLDPPPPELLRDLRLRGLAIYVVPAGTSFVLGDSVGVLASIASQSDDQPIAIEFMPIASDVAIGYSSTGGEVRVQALSENAVRQMNEATAKESFLIAGRSRALIASLSQTLYDPPRIAEEMAKFEAER